MKKEYYGILAGLGVLIFLFVGILTRAIFMGETNTSLKNDVKSNNIKEDLDVIYDDNIVAAALKVPLTIKNTQNTSAQLEYVYDITIDDVSGAVEAKINDESEYIVFDSKGYTQVKLTSNSTLTLYNLPLDVKYTIKQSSIDSYQTKIDGEKTNYYSGTTKLENNITFENIGVEVKENPKTADPILISVILMIIVSVTLLFLSKTKYHKFDC